MTRIAPALAVCLVLLSSTAYSAEKRLDIHTSGGDIKLLARD